MKQKLLIAVALIVALAGGIYLSVNLAPPQSAEHAKLYPQPRALPDFTLVNHNGEPFGRETFEGHWTLVFTGYTYCPDICPTTLAELKSIYPQLQQLDSDYPIQVMLLSVDPKRDTPERLKEYISFFNPEFLAATAEHTELFPFVRALGMMYAMSDSTDNPDYLVDHSASVVIINPQAQVIGRFTPTLMPGEMAVVNPQHILKDMPFIIN
ncbi:SCO family protein [Lacimicrobium alkaliphilum]|uniref:Photosynthetic protein synthase I n=1 Tax=Lacimicrobium alkaliphilum TaxID=1526571 RepID=A0ABQ1RTU2_9ALTE|nr:SCO family protein [Lacimicrobium alkaliphilum]GGD77173.1 photosynthetic protein synthase I [Lacimicrobium alkaliphilum]